MVIADPTRLLPDGQVVHDLAADEQELALFTTHIDSAVLKWSSLAGAVGEQAVLAMLACVAGWLAPHWWGTPWWPARVERFLARGSAGSCSTMTRSASASRSASGSDLRRGLLAGLDRLDVDVASRCLRAGLGDLLLLPVPRVRRAGFAPMALLLEPEVPRTAELEAWRALTTQASWCR